MSRVSVSFAGLIILALLFVSAPFFAKAFPFGGQTQVHHYCYNTAIYALLGPPRGGPYIWTPSTKTYLFGPPSGVGQWLLGLTGPPYYCVVSRSPIFVKEGISIMMMGSSGPAAPSHPALSGGVGTGGGGTSSGGTGTGTGTGGGSGSGGTSGGTGGGSGQSFIGHVVFSEVYPETDLSHGSDPTNEWVELYNGDTNSVDVSGWSISDDSGIKRTIPSGNIMAPGTFLILSPTSDTASFWTVIPPTKVVSLGNSIGNGLSRTGDTLLLQSPSGAIVDSMSWGTSQTAFTPSIPTVDAGHSMTRTSFTQDTNTRSEWQEAIVPSPGAED